MIAPGLSGSARPTRHGVPSALAPSARISPMLTRVVDSPRGARHPTTRSVAYPWAMPFSVIAAPCLTSATRSSLTRRPPAAHFRQRVRQPFGRRTVGIRLFRREVFGVELPQRLDGRIERAVGKVGELQRGFEQRYHVGLRSDQDAAPVQGADGGIRPVQAELPLQPSHLRQANLDDPFSFLPIGMEDVDRHLGAERRSAPAHGFARPGTSLRRKETPSLRSQLRWRSCVGA